MYRPAIQCWTARVAGGTSRPIGVAGREKPADRARHGLVGEQLDAVQLLTALGVPGQRSVGESALVGLVDHPYDADRRDHTEGPTPGRSTATVSTSTRGFDAATEIPARSWSRQPSTARAARSKSVRPKPTGSVRSNGSQSSGSASSVALTWS